MRCQWIYVKLLLNTMHQCNLLDVNETNRKRKLVLLSAHLPVASKQISLSLSSREQWNRYTYMESSSGALNCNAHPNSAGLVGAVRLLASSVDLFILTSLDLREHSESFFYRLYFSVLCNVNSYWLSTWQSKLQRWSS